MAMTIEEKIRANADLIREHLSQQAGFELGYDSKSIKWLDGFIERQRDQGQVCEKQKSSV